jgi:hypothetical protein
MSLSNEAHRLLPQGQCLSLFCVAVAEYLRLGNLLRREVYSPPVLEARESKMEQVSGV